MVNIFNQVASTKGNLIAAKKSLALARLGFELLDRKRNILVRELMMLINRAEELQNKIRKAYSTAYLLLQKANIALGVCEEVAYTVGIENGLNMSSKSVMGVEIPVLSLNTQKITELPFGLSHSNSDLDKAFNSFAEVKKLTAMFAEVENSVFLLANAIKKTQKRANALKNIMIPKFADTEKFITNELEEKEREEFSRLKVIKKNKEYK